MITGLFICAWLILGLAPDTSVGRFLHRWMLYSPIDWTARITRGQVVLGVLLLVFAGVAVWLLKAEAGPLLGLATPDISIAIASFEVTTWLDAVTGALLLATTVRWRALNLGRFRRAYPRRRRHGRVRPITRSPANDDDRPPWIAAA